MRYLNWHFNSTEGVFPKNLIDLVDALTLSLPEVIPLYFSCQYQCILKQTVDEN